MTEIMLIILSVAFLLFAGFSIPFLLQIWRTAKGMAETLEILNRDLPVIMGNLEQITTNINRQVAELSLTLRRVQGIIGVFLGVGEVLRHRMSFPFARTVMTSLAVFKGVRTFVGVLTDRSPDVRGGKAQMPR